MDFIAGLLELFGAWKVGSKNANGFIYNLICNIFWIVYVLTSGQTYGLLLVVVPMAFINMRNFFRWRKDDD